MAKVKSKRRRRDATMEQALYWKQIYTEIRTEKVLATIRKLMVDQSEDGQREVEPPTFRSLSPRPNGFASASATGRLGYTLSLIHISEPTRLGMISYAVFCLKK